MTRARILTLTLPLPPNRGNARGHWSRHHRGKHVYWARCIGSRKSRIPLSTRAISQRAELTAVLYVWNRYDRDGSVALLKWAIDWLVERGFLVDDSPAHLEWAGMPEQHIDRKSMRIVLTVRELEEDKR